MKLKMLVIEDDKGIVDAISMTLNSYWPEAEMISAHCGEAGIRLAESEAPDVVIIDLGLPDISGHEVLRQIRSVSSVPIIVLTVRSGEGDVIKAMEAEANDYVVKPFRPKELLARIEAHVTRWMAGEVKSVWRKAENDQNRK